MSQKAWFTSTNSPASVTTASPTAVWSNASRIRSNPSRAGCGRTAAPIGGSAHLRGGACGHARQRVAERLAGARPERLREALEDVLVWREVHQLLGLDH